MLKEIEQNISPKKMSQQKLNIHHANLFTPNLQEIFKLAWDLYSRSLAILRKINQHGHPITLIEIYKMKDSSCPPKLIRTYREYEELTDIVWFNSENFMTASKEQNLNFYSIERGIKIATKITDYGPITSLKYIHEERLLFTGTEYGHLIAYRMHPKGKTVEPLNKMVKVNASIKTLVISKTKRPEPQKVVVVNPPSSRIIPGKRKRTDSDDEEEDEEDKVKEKIDSLDTLDITIYGSCENNVVVWSYHKKNIIETMNVCDKTEHVTSLLALRNGDIVAGDSTGSINIIDHKTFTCRQTIKLLSSPITCVVKDEKENRILVSGQDPSVFTLTKKTTNQDELVLFEKMKFQAHKLNSIAFMSNKEYFLGGDDGILVKVGIKRGQKDKVTVPPRYVDKIKCSKKELMFQYDKSLVVWKLKKTRYEDPETMPKKHLLLKTRDFIETSTITFDYISYSTKKGLYILDRKVEKPKPVRQIKWSAGGAQGCNILKFCSQAKYLVYATMKILTFVSLVKGTTPKVEIHLKSPIKQIIELKQYPDLVAIVCLKHFYLYKLSKHKLVTKLDLGNAEVLFAARDKKCANIYIYTFHDQLARIKIIDDANVALEKTGKPIEGLPNDVNMLGMLCIPNDHCILFEPERMFKVDLVANKVVNVNTDYKYILKMDFLFNNSEHVSLVELRPDYYTRLLPSVATKNFGSK